MSCASHSNWGFELGVRTGSDEDATPEDLAVGLQEGLPLVVVLNISGHHPQADGRRYLRIPRTMAEPWESGGGS